MCGERVNLSPTALYTGRSLEVGHGGSLRRLKLSSPGSGPFAVERVSLTSPACRVRVVSTDRRAAGYGRG
jgi:hypothetical protein